MFFKITSSLITVFILGLGSCKPEPRPQEIPDPLPECVTGLFEMTPAACRHEIAFQLIGAGKFRQAEQKLQEMITLHPEFYGAYRTLGEVLINYIEAGSIITFLNGLTEQDPGNSYAYWALGLVFAQQQQYDTASTYFRQVIRLNPGFCDAYENLADANRREASPSSLAAVESFFRELQEKGVPGAAFGLACLLNQEGQPEALRLLAELKTEPLFPGRLYKFLGTSYLKEKQTQTALAYYQCALGVFREYGDKQGEAAVLINQGIAFDQLLDFEKALEKYRQALLLARILSNKAYEGSILINMGICFKNIREYEKSFEYYHKALEHFKGMDTPDSTMKNLIIYNNLGQLSEIFTDYTRALEYYKNALELSRQIKNSGIISGIILNNIAEIYKRQEKYEAALDRYSQALGLFSGLEAFREKAVALNNIGEIQTATGHYQEALDNFELSLANRKKTGDRQGQGITIGNMGYIYYLKGEYGKALGYYKKALLLTGVESAEGMEITSNIGICYSALKNYNEALKNLEKSIKQTERIRSRLKDKNHKTGFMQNSQLRYDALIDLLYDMDKRDPEKGYSTLCFRYAEKSKAGTLLNLLEEGRIEIKKGIPPALATRAAAIEKKYSALHTELQEALKKTEPETEGSRLKDLQQELSRLENEYEDVQASMAIENPRYQQLNNAEPVSGLQVQECLKDSSTLLLEYHITKETIFAWCFTREKSSVYKLVIQQDSLRKMVLNLYASLSRPDGSHAYISLSRTLYKVLIQPLLPPGPEFRRIIIIPDGILYYLPFEVLLTSDPEAGAAVPPYLALPYSTQYSQSATIFYHLSSRQNEPGLQEDSLLAVGAPVFSRDDPQETAPGLAASGSLRAANLKALPYSNLEVREIGKFFVHKLILTGHEATEERIKEPDLLSGFTYIHFATHNILDQENPQSSGLVLTQDDDPMEDGFLQMREIFNLETRAKLVVLSACKTSLGQYVNGEGIIGLTRAWMYAGSPSVITTLWNIEDESTAAFMDTFYRHIKEGLTFAAALRQARLWLMKQAGYHHPYYWAGFVLTGKG